MKTSIHRLLVIVALICPATVLHAQIYKWKDAHGTVHFSQAPPAQGTHYSEIKTHVISAADDSSQHDSDAPPPVAPDPKVDVPPQPVANTPENRIALCKALDKNLEALKGSGPVVMQQNGKFKALDASQRKQQLIAAQAREQQYCQVR